MTSFYALGVCLDQGTNVDDHGPDLGVTNLFY